MSKEIKEYVSEIHELFDEVSDKVEDSAADFADDARELWGETKQQLQKVTYSILRTKKEESWSVNV